MVAAARAAGVDVYDTPFTDVNDDEGIRIDTEKAKALGFTGKASISPRHVPVINEVFSPSMKDIEYAYEVMEAIRIGKEQVGYTHPTELYRVDGLMGFKDSKGRKAKIAYATDTTAYEAVSKGWHSAMATGHMLIVDDEIVVPVLMGDKADGENVAAMAQEQKQGAKIRTHYTSALFYDKRHPRAAFGTDDEGNAYLVVIDGRFKGQADGASIYETAYVCHLLGMTDAINLDGGGSTTLWTEKTGVINYPCDNKTFDHNGERSVPNLIAVY